MQLRVWSLTLSLLLVAQAGTARADLPPETNDLIRKGLDAVQKGNFEDAARSFQLASEKKPEAYREIGTDESKIPGRELRAICWLAAYLAAQPTASDAAGVHSQINVLQAAIHEKILELIQSAEAAVRQMPSGEDRDHTLLGLANIWETWGDEMQARKVVDAIESKGVKSDAFSNLASAYAEKGGRQFEDGDMAGSQASLASAADAILLIPFPDTKSYPEYRIALAHLVIARQKIRMKDIAGARASMATAQQIAETIGGSWRSDTENSIATTEIGLGRALFKSGDATGAKEAFDRAYKMADLIQQPSSKHSFLIDLADAQTKAGDFQGARASLAAALPLASVYNDAGHARMEIARAQAKANDLAAAQSTVDLITDGKPSWRYDARHAIAEEQIKKDDRVGAQKSLAAALEAVETYKEGEGKFEALRQVADAQIRAGDSKAALATMDIASKMIDSLYPDPGRKPYALEAIAEAQFKAGDKTAALKTAGLIENAEIKSNTMKTLAGSPDALHSLYSEPMEFPVTSEILGSDSRVNADSWIWMLRENFDEPWFTAYPDFSNYMAMADQILRAPVKNGLMRAYAPMDKAHSLVELARCMATAQGYVDSQLKTQFRK